MITKLPIMLFVILFSTVCFAGDIKPEKGCRNNPEIVDECFTVHGRISVYNGTPSVRLWPIGTKHLIGILPSENEIMPDSIKNRLDFRTNIYGDFLVCPFTKVKERQMQDACIEKASNLVVKTKY